MDRLTQLLKAFENLGIIVHPDVGDDLKGIFKNSGNAQRFLSVFTMRLKQLKAYGPKATNLFSQHFEKLKGAQHYAMRCRSKNSNIRIIYNYSKEKELILLAFDRKEGKGASDYSAFIPDADRRYQELCQNNQEGHHE